MSHYYQPGDPQDVADAAMNDWIDILSPYTQAEIENACASYLKSQERKRPTPADIRGPIIAGRDHKRRMAYLSAPRQDLTRIEEQRGPKVTPEAAARILAEAGFSANPTAEDIAARKAMRAMPACPICGSREDYTDGHCFECEHRAEGASA